MARAGASEILGVGTFQMWSDCCVAEAALSWTALLLDRGYDPRRGIIIQSYSFR